MPAVSDSVWSAQDTHPDEIDSALRRLLAERHAESSAFVPGRVLNLVCVVDAEWSGEIANRLRGVGRYHASRTVVCAVEPGRETLDATASVVADSVPGENVIAMTRETVIVKCGPHHLANLDSIVDPLVVTDLATVVWSPHGHEDALRSLLHLAQVVLLDSIDEPDAGKALRRASSLSEQAYVVDLAWLRGTPWRERVAASFDPRRWRPELSRISALTIRHHRESRVSALLLAGWLASRLDWRPGTLTAQSAGYAGRLRAPRGDVLLTLESVAQDTRGLAGVTVETAAGMSLSLDRGVGGLRAVRRSPREPDKAWTVLGASRGEPGILGEGIRQGLLRDPTYRPALAAAEAML